MQNIIATLFEVESEGFQAITELKQAPVTEGYSILQMALVKTEEGKVTVCDGFDSSLSTRDHTIKGGLIGGLIGILGGPIGVLLLGSYGALAGSVMDMGDAASGVSMLEMVVDKLQDNAVALVILADEKDEAALDAKLGGNTNVEILRYDAEAIAAEVDEAVMMEKEMARQTRSQLRKERKAEFRQKVQDRHDRLENEYVEIKEKLEAFGEDANVD